MLAHRQLSSLVMLSVSAFTTHAIAGVRYVDDDAAGGDGTSWQTAYRSLQDALIDPDATEIRIAAGVYRPDEGAGMTAGDRDATFVIAPAMMVLGGYRGLAGGGDADDRDVVAFETLLSGDLSENDGADFTNYADNSFHVLSTDGANGWRTVDGLTIRAGNADDFGDRGDGGGVLHHAGALLLQNCRLQANRAKEGGAVFVKHTSTELELIDCSIIDNLATTNGGGMFIYSTPVGLTGCRLDDNESAVHGGGIYNREGASTLTDCTFDANQAGSGNGGAYYATNADPSFARCHFTANKITAPGGGGGAGGAVYHFNFSQGTYYECTFVNNHASTGGAIGALYNGSYPRVYDCLFAQCSANNGGGAITAMVGTPVIDRSTFLENSGGTGGAVQVGTDAQMTITNSRFLGNQTTTSLNQGGAISTTGMLTAVGCLFSGNHANNGGAVRCFGAGTNTRIFNCTMTNNTATTDGGGIYDGHVDHNLDIRGSILWQNQDAGGTDSTAQVQALVGFDVEVDYSCVQGWTGAIAGIGNFAVNPQMNDPVGDDNQPGTLDDNARLSATSPAINAGDPAFDAASIVGDLDGHARLLCARVDMGAYEFGIGDFNCDRQVNINDFTAWDACSTLPDSSFTVNGCEAFDFDADDDVDTRDFGGLQTVLPGA